MKKILYSLVAACALMSVSASANEKPMQMQCQEGQDCGCNHKKMENLSVEDIKKHVGEKVAFKEKNIAAEKECLNKTDKAELVGCLQKVKEDKKEFKKEHKGEHKGEHKKPKGEPKED